MGRNVGQQTVLVVDDQRDVADVLAAKVGEEYETRIAYGGREALEAFDESVDAVLLDRRMPDVHGDDVLAEIRERDRDCVVIVTTAVNPDLNILEMEFDDYLTKPIERETLLSTLDQHLDSRTGDPRLEELFATLSKVDVLESRHPPTELAESDEYEALLARVEELRGELAASEEDVSELIETFREINRS